MSVEGVGGLGDGVGAAVSAGPAVSIGGPSISAGIEGGIAGAVSVSGLTGSFRGPVFEVAPAMPGLGKGLDFFGPPMGTVNLPPTEGPAGLEGFRLEEKIMPTPIGKVDPKVEIRFNNNPLPGYVPVEPVVCDVGGQLKPKDWLFGPTITVAINPALEPKPGAVPANEPAASNTRIMPEAVTETGLAFSESKMVDLAEEWLKITKPKIEPAVIPVPAPRNSESIQVQLVTSPALEGKARVQSKAENQTASLAIPVTEPQTELVEEEIEEIAEQAAQPENEVTGDEVEDTEITKTKIVESVETARERRIVILAAVREAIRLGTTVKKALSERFYELISPLVKGKKDWTIDLTADELNINPAKFSSTRQVEEVALESVANNAPLEEGEEGRQATIGEVRKVISGEDDKLKPKIPAEIVKKRIIRKKVIVVTRMKPGWTIAENKTEVTQQENTLQKLNLAAVFHSS